MKNHLVLFSPLPPIENGIADYTFEILQAQREFASIFVVIANNAPIPPAISGVEILFLEEYEHRYAELCHFPHIYQVGNNADHVYMLEIAKRNPGCVVLHDVSLHHLIDQATLRVGAVDEYKATLRREFGSPGQVLAEQFDHDGRRERLMFYELPLIRELLDSCSCVLVHSFYAATKVLAQNSSVPVVILKHHIAPSAIEASHSLTKSSVRARLSVPEDELLFVSLGFVTKAKQIEPLLRVLASCRNDLPRFRYVIAGQDDPQNFDLRSLIAELNLSDVVQITGYISEAEFYDFAVGSDVIFNLRYPTGGETSGTLIRALGVGACVVVVDIGPFSEYPDDVCLKLAWSDNFERDLESAIRQLAGNASLRGAYGERAKIYIQDTHAMEQACRAYNTAVTLYGSARRVVTPHLLRAAVYEFPTRGERERLFATVRSLGLPLWYRNGLVPFAKVGSSPALLVGDNLEVARELMASLHYDPQHIVDISCQNFVITAQHSQAELILLSVNLDKYDDIPGLWRKLNEVLLVGGLLIIEDVSSTYASTGAQMVATGKDAGFELIRSALAPIDVSPVFDGDYEQSTLLVNCPCWLFSKYSNFIKS